MSKKMRLHPEPLHAPRAARQHAHPAPPKAHRPHATAVPAGRGLGTVAPPPNPYPVVLHDLHTRVQGQDWNVCHLGFGGQGSYQAFLLVLALPGETHPVGKLSAHGALETPSSWLTRPRAGGRKPRWQVEVQLTTMAETSPRGLGEPGSLPHPQGGVHPADIRRVLQELVITEGADVEALTPLWVFVDLTGEAASVGEFRFLLCGLFFCFKLGGRWGIALLGNI